VTTYALDTNIISYFLKGNQSVQRKFKETLANRDSLIIPPIVYYEAKRGFLLNPAPSKEKTFERMCALYSVGTLSNTCLDCAAKLYAEARSIGHNADAADLFIAAFCIVEGYTLVTANMRHFEAVKGLQLVNWAE
jgi:predicted nucleic acid-binding protein